MRDFQKLTDYCVRVFIKHGLTECDSEEYAQEAVVRLITSAAEIENDQTYLYTVCLNILRHRARGRKRFYKAAAPVYFSQQQPTSPLDEVIRNEDPTDEILALLPPAAASAFRVSLDRDGNGKKSEGTNIKGRQRAAIWRAKEALRRSPRVKDLLS